MKRLDGAVARCVARLSSLQRHLLGEIWTTKIVGIRVGKYICLCAKNNRFNLVVNNISLKSDILEIEGNVFITPI